MFDKLFLVLLCVFLLIFGIDAVTNIEVVWMSPIMGLCALAAGLIGLFNAFSRQ